MLEEKFSFVLPGVPGVLTVQPDENIESEIKDYGGIFTLLHLLANKTFAASEEI